jgi:large conductance mechanosensitive channel
MASKEVQEKMLEELQKIRASVEPKPTAPSPPPAPPKGFMKEFMAFLDKYGIIGLAIAFIIGGAAGRLVTALVADILMPIITFFIPGGEWRKSILPIGPINLAVGDFVGALIDFIVIAVIVFLLMKQLAKTGLK